VCEGHSDAVECVSFQHGASREAQVS
jgi:hypothetical protein